MEKKIKHTYKYYVSGLYELTGSSYHYFKSFKVYWAWQWYESEQIDKRGIGKQTREDPTGTKERFYTNYAEKFIPSYEIITVQNNWKYSINWYGKLLNFIRIKLKLKHRI